MQLKTIAGATVSACLVVACGANGSGPMEGYIDPAGPFSGMGYPGTSIYRNPGIFSGSGSPGVAGTNDPTSLCVGVCIRVNAVCPRANTNQDVCASNCLSDWNKLTTACARNQYYAFMTCLMSASITCNDKGQAATESCQSPSLSVCGPTSNGNTTGTGGTDGTGGSTGGTGGTGGSTGGTGGTGGNTGGTGGSGGTGGAAGRGGTAGRDAGRG